MDLTTYKNNFNEDDAVGWISIDQKLEELYPRQEPKHFAPAVYYSLGGEDPIDGISVYQSCEQMDHFHFVTYGFSELYYDEESAGGDYSKFGFELTFRLKKDSEADNLNWACNLIQNIAKYVFKTGKYFEEFHIIPANGPIRSAYDTQITALAFIADPELGNIETPHGEVVFLQMFGLTTAEYEKLKQHPSTETTEQLLLKIKKENNLMITNLDRK